MSKLNLYSKNNVDICRLNCLFICIKKNYNKDRGDTMLNSVILKIKKSLNDFLINKKLTTFINLMSDEITYVDNFKNVAFNKPEVAYILSNHVIFKEEIQEVIYKKTKSYYNESKSKVSLKFNCFAYLDNDSFYDVFLLVIVDLVTGKLININVNQSIKNLQLKKNIKM